MIKRIKLYTNKIIFFLCLSAALSPSYAERKGEVTAPFLHVGPFHLCIIKDYEIKGYIRLTIDLLFESTEKAHAMEYWIPRSQSQYIIEFSQILGQFWIGGSMPDLSRVKTILKRITDKTLGKNQVKDILFQTYFFADPPKEEKLDEDTAS